MGRCKEEEHEGAVLATAPPAGGRRLAAAEVTYLLGHLEADVGAELQHLAHLLGCGRDQRDLPCGGRVLKLSEPSYELIISRVLQAWGIQTKTACLFIYLLTSPHLRKGTSGIS